MKTLGGLVKWGVILFACYWLLAQLVGGLPLSGFANRGGTAMTLPSGS